MGDEQILLIIIMCMLYFELFHIFEFSIGKPFFVIACCNYIIGGLICVNMIYWFA